MYVAAAEQRRARSSSVDHTRDTSRASSTLNTTATSIARKLSSMVGGDCGGGRSPRRVDSSPRPSLAMKTKKRSKRSRLSAALRELKVAAKARDKDGLLQILVTGHRASRGGSEDGDASGTSTGRSVAGEQREPVWRQGGGADAAPKAGGPLLESGRPVATGGACGRGRGCASWALAAALVLALACVVALGTAPAICCCTCAAWLCGDRGAQEHASDSPRARAAAGEAPAVAA